MPSAPPKHCPAGHPAYHGRCCPLCHARRKAEADARRPSARERGYSRKWDQVAKAFLARPENFYCACGCGRRADCVDHVKAHKGDMRLFWDKTNWRPMARACNTRKAIREEGGFGRPIKPQDRGRG